MVLKNKHFSNTNPCSSLICVDSSCILENVLLLLCTKLLISFLIFLIDIKGDYVKFNILEDVWAKI